MVWGKEHGTVDSPEGWENGLGTVDLQAEWGREHGIVDLQEEWESELGTVDLQVHQYSYLNKSVQ